MNPPEQFPGPEGGMPQKRERKDEVLFTRHSKALYKPYADVLKGEDPEQAMDYEKQPDLDLPEAGVALASEKAIELFKTMDPEEDALFFVTSPERRAIDTANIYRLEAKQKGFEILAPEHVRGELAEKVGEGELRILEALSSNISNVLVSTVFNPNKLYDPSAIRWDAVQPETKEKYEKAREIISVDDRGSWGANFAVHSEEIAKLFPGEMQSALDLYQTQFKNLMRLARFAVRKAKESGSPKNIKVLAFGHENYFSHALEKYFAEHDIGNCETIGIRTDKNNTVELERRGARRTIGEQEIS